MVFKFENFNIQLALALSAASALIYEIVVTNVLFFYFIESSYSIATVLGVFLFGLGAGSLLIYFLSPKIKNKILLFGSLQIIIALYAFFILTNLTKVVDRISTLGTFVTSFTLLLIPTIFLGAIFPLAGSIFKKRKKEVIGLVYSSDLFGAIVGVLFAGFVLIPLYGAKITIIFAVGLNIMSSFIILSKKYKLIPIFLAVFLLIISMNFGGLVEEKTSEYQFYSPSPYGVVKVKNNVLIINEREQCSLDYPNYTSERLMVDYALEPFGEKENLQVLNIGLGCGLTLERVLQYGAEVDVVEINPKVVMANKIMTDVLQNKNVNLIVDDGLKYLRENKKKYDVIFVDIENPRVAHSSNLYTVEAFKIINDSLNEDGKFALWNYVWRSKKNDVDLYADILYYSIKEAFDFVYEYPGVFLASKHPLNETEYIPQSDYEINTIDRKTLIRAMEYYR